MITTGYRIETPRPPKLRVEREMKEGNRKEVNPRSIGRGGGGKIATERHKERKYVNSNAMKEW
jgi:hypothetical protein